MNASIDLLRKLVMNGNEGQKSTDSFWLITELSSIRAGLENLVKLSTTTHERVISVQTEQLRTDNRLAVVEKDVSILKEKNITKESSWLGVWKLMAIIPTIAALMAIMFYLVQLGILKITGS